MNKLINVNDYKKIIISKLYNIKSDEISIKEAFFNNGELEKTIEFFISDDFYFNAYSLNKSLDSISLDYDIDNPMFFSLNRLLGTNDSLIIDDDDTLKELTKYIEIKRINQNINIAFYNKQKDNADSSIDVFIKNIVSDGRSKIYDFNIKYRLVTFFREAEDILLNDNHQYTLDEYFELLKRNGHCTGSNSFLIEKMKFKNPGECCSNCDYVVSSEMIENIIKENSEYSNMTYEEAENIIGNCEYGFNIKELSKMDYWCENYYMNEKYKNLVKK